MAITLRAYLAKQKLTQTEFADRIGVSQGLIHQWLKGITRITPERAEQIEKATGGKVKKEALVFGQAA